MSKWPKFEDAYHSVRGFQPRHGHNGERLIALTEEQYETARLAIARVEAAEAIAENAMARENVTADQLREQAEAARGVVEALDNLLPVAGEWYRELRKRDPHEIGEIKDAARALSAWEAVSRT